jgi:PD-(D/E)XK nuclease superfamily protein
MVYRLHTSDRTAFKRCRRQWDFSSGNRRNLEPIAHPGSVDLNKALRDALAVYYFPGMWEWDQSIVRPLVHKAMDRSLRSQTEGAAANAALQESLDRGHALLDAYAAWAPTVDHFTPIRVETDFEVNIPDPARPGVSLLTSAGDEVRYCGRVDLLVIDPDDAYWVVQHRLVTEGWADHDALQLDEQTIMWAWAWPQFYLGMQIAGTLYNEIHADAGELGAAQARAPEGRAQVGHRRMYARSGSASGERLHAEGNDSFRRTRIRRGEAELAAASADLAAEVAAATSPDLQIYPSPAPEVCSRCLYRSPCLILNQGQDPTAELAKSYRPRPPEHLQEGRLGGVTWSMNRGAAPPPWARKQ